MTATYKILPVPAGSVTVLCYYYIKLVRHCVNWRGHVRSCPGKKDALPIYSPGNITLVKIPLRALGIKSPIRYVTYDCRRVGLAGGHWWTSYKDSQQQPVQSEGCSLISPDRFPCWDCK